jgi:hypothetical protein
VALVFLVVAVASTVWLLLDRRPPEWDHANHLERVVHCARDLGNGDLAGILERSGFYPPVVPCAAALLYRLAPSDAVTAQSIVLAFLGLGMGAVYLLGRQVAGGPAGTAAAVLFGTAPFVLFSSVRFQLDLPLAAMVAVALAVLVRTDGFGRGRWSVAAGIVLGLGMLTKPPFAVYVLPGLAVVAARARGRRALANLAVTLVLGAAVSVPWYGPRLLGLPQQIAARSFKQAAESGYPSALSAESLLMYPRAAVTTFGLVATILLLAGLGLAFRRRLAFLVLSALGPFVVFELIQNKNFRYLLPLLPIAAVTAGLTVDALRGRWRVLTGVAVAGSAALHLGATFAGVPPVPVLPVLGVALALPSPPARGDWRQREILRAIVDDSRGQASRVSVVPNDNFFSVSNFRYYGVRDGLPLTFTRAWDRDPIGIDYVILKTGDLGPDATEARLRRLAERFTTDPHLARAFPVIHEVDLPDGSVGTVRARRLVEPLPVTPHAVARRLEHAIRRELPGVARDVEGLAVSLSWDAAILTGRVERVELEVGGATAGEHGRAGAPTLRLRDVRLVVENLVVNPWSLLAEERLDVLDVGRIRVERATVTARDFRAFLAGLRRLRQTTIELGDGFVAFHASQPGPDVSGRVRFVRAADRPVGLAADEVRIAGIPVPQLFVDWVLRNYDPTLRMASRLPAPLELGRVVIDRSGLRVVAAP